MKENSRMKNQRGIVANEEESEEKEEGSSSSSSAHINLVGRDLKRFLYTIRLRIEDGRADRWTERIEALELEIFFRGWKQRQVRPRATRS